MNQRVANLPTAEEEWWPNPEYTLTQPNNLEQRLKYLEDQISEIQSQIVACKKAKELGYDYWTLYVRYLNDLRNIKALQDRGLDVQGTVTTSSVKLTNFTSLQMKDLPNELKNREHYFKTKIEELEKMVRFVQTQMEEGCKTHSGWERLQEQKSSLARIQAHEREMVEAKAKKEAQRLAKEKKAEAQRIAKEKAEAEKKAHLEERYKYLLRFLEWEDKMEDSPGGFQFYTDVDGDSLRDMWEEYNEGKISTPEVEEELKSSILEAHKSIRDYLISKLPQEDREVECKLYGCDKYHMVDITDHGRCAGGVKYWAGPLEVDDNIYGQFSLKNVESNPHITQLCEYGNH